MTPAAGRLTTHVLDTARGRPAAGVRRGARPLDGRRTVLALRADERGRPHGRAAARGRRAGPGRLRARLRGRRLLRDRGPAGGAAVPRPRADPLRDRRRGRAPPRAAARLALVVLDLPRAADGRAPRVMARGPTSWARSARSRACSCARYGSHAHARGPTTSSAAGCARPGMDVRRDAVGNLVGRYAGARPRRCLLGSHLDTVRDAGRYDGPLGVLVAIAVRRSACTPRRAAAVRRRGRRRSPTRRACASARPTSAARAFAGRFEPRLLAVRDADGVTLADAVRAFGGDPDALAGDARDPADAARLLRGAHRAGPGARAARPPGRRGHARSPARAGSRSTLAGRGRPRGHGADGRCAGTRCAPRPSSSSRSSAWRREPRAGRHGGPPRGRARRGQRDPRRGGARRSTCATRTTPCAARAVEELRAHAERIAGARGVELEWELPPGGARGARRRGARERLADAVGAAGVPVVELPSGAGHDAAEVAAVAPIACCSCAAAAASATIPTSPSRRRRRRGARRARALPARARRQDAAHDRARARRARRLQGHFTAPEVAAAIAGGIRAAGLEADELPIADGGSGTMAALRRLARRRAARRARERPARATRRGALGAAARRARRWSRWRRRAGSRSSPPTSAIRGGRRPRGTGELIAAAARAGAETVLVGGRRQRDDRRRRGRRGGAARGGRTAAGHCGSLCDVRRPSRTARACSGRRRAPTTRWSSGSRERLHELAGPRPRDPRGGR